MKSVNASVKTIQYDTEHLKCIQNLTDTQLYLTHLSKKKNTKRKELKNTTFYFVLRSVVMTLLCIESILRVRVHLCVCPSAESLQACYTERHVEPSAGLLYGDQR